MTAIYLQSFLRDVKKLRDRKVQRAVAAAIENVEAADSVLKIRALKRLSGQTDYYRIRIGDWRIGLKIIDNVVTFVRCLHRREVYRYFP
jgi:mRNA interferase RelE/StbE